jgi:hypothetical protein
MLEISGLDIPGMGIFARDMRAGWVAVRGTCTVDYDHDLCLNNYFTPPAPPLEWQASLGSTGSSAAYQASSHTYVIQSNTEGQPSVGYWNSLSSLSSL